MKKRTYILLLIGFCFLFAAKSYAKMGEFHELFGQAIDHYKQKEYAKAYELAQRAERLTIGDPEQAHLQIEVTIFIALLYSFNVDPEITDPVRKNYAISYILARKPPPPIEHSMKEVEFRKTELSEDSPLITTSTFVLARYYENNKDHENANTYYEEALTGSKKVFGEKDPYTALAMEHLGISYGKLKDTLSELEFLRDALKLYQEIFGIKDFNTKRVASSLDALGFKFRRSSDFLKAIECYYLILPVYIERARTEKHDLSVLYHKLEICYEELGIFVKAIEHSRKELEISKQRNKHDYVIQVITDLAYLHEKKGDTAGALKVYDEEEKGLEGDPLRRSKLLFSKARFYEEIGQPDNAIETYKRVLEIRIPLFYQETPRYLLSTFNSLTRLRIDKQEYDQAGISLVGAIRIIESDPQISNYFDYCWTLFLRAKMAMKENQFKIAMEFLGRAAKIINSIEEQSCPNDRVEIIDKESLPRKTMTTIDHPRIEEISDLLETIRLDYTAAAGELCDEDLPAATETHLKILDGREKPKKPNGKGPGVTNCKDTFKDPKKKK